MFTELELFHIMQGLRLLGMNMSNMKEDILQLGHDDVLSIEHEIEDVYYKVEKMYNEKAGGGTA